MRHPGFQGGPFDVSYAVGDVLEQLLGFANDVERPEKLLLHLRQAGWCSLFLSAYLACWDTHDADVVAEIHEDYAGVPLVDYGKLFRLEGARVLAISCIATETSSDSVALLFDRGKLTLAAVDPRDHESTSALVWQLYG